MTETVPYTQPDAPPALEPLPRVPRVNFSGIQPGWVWEHEVAREELGRGHYYRLRLRMEREAGIYLPSWQELTGTVRESYRARMDYLVPYAVQAMHVVRDA